MGSQDYDASISSLENREEEFLREQMKTEQELRQCLDKLAEGHPGAGDPQYEQWKARDDQAGSEANESAKELGEAAIAGAGVGENPLGGITAAEHIYESYKHRHEMLDARHEANEIAEPWREELRTKIDSLQERLQSLDKDRESIAGDAQDLKDTILEGQGDLLHDAQRQDELRDLCNYASRLDGILRALGH